MTSVSAGRIGPVGGVRRDGSGNGGGATGQLLDSIAADVVGRIAGELNLAVDPDGKRGTPLAGHDLYGIDESAAALADQLGATPQEAGEITRLLHLFAAEVAARIAAVPDALSVEEIAGLLTRRMTEATNAQSAIGMIRQATSDLAA